LIGLRDRVEIVFTVKFATVVVAGGNKLTANTTRTRLSSVASILALPARVACRGVILRGRHHISSIIVLLPIDKG
jgi:hypothetical protein